MKTEQSSWAIMILEDFTKKIKLSYLLLLLAGIIAVYLYFFSYIDSSYSPYYGDEYFYFKNSESFYLTNSLEASFTYSGAGAKIWGADAHGPAYPLVYGLGAKLIGWGALTIPAINLGVLVSAVLLLLFSWEGSNKTKILLVLLILGNPLTLFYSVTYLTELLQLSAGIYLFLATRRYLHKERQEDFLLLLLLIMVMGSIRSTWFFTFFGLLILPGPLKGISKSIYAFLGLSLPFLFQYFFHEQVPNTFSELLNTAGSDVFRKVFNSIFENFVKNIRYAFTYADGDFYLMQKIWFYSTLCISIIFFRKYKLISFGLVVLGSIILFNLTLYYNFTWVDLRMYTPMTLFLNLSMLASQSRKVLMAILLIMNLGSFVLILPLQQVIMNYRTPSKNHLIPDRINVDIQKLDSPIIYVDTAILHNYKIVELPLLTETNGRITYILPYYTLPSKEPTHYLVEEVDHWCTKSVKILSQKTTPKNTCRQ